MRGWHLLCLWPGVAGDVLKVCHAPEAHAALDLGNDFSFHTSLTVMERVTCMCAAITAKLTLYPDSSQRRARLLYTAR